MSGRGAAALALAGALVCRAAGAPAAEPAAEPVPAPVPVVPSSIAEGMRLYQAQDYAKAAVELRRAARDPATTRAQRIEALEHLGLAHLILGDRARATEAFEDLLRLDPAYRLSDPSLSPKMLRLFEQVRAQVASGAASGGALLEHDAPAIAVAGRPFEVTAALPASAAGARQVALRWRRTGRVSYRDEALAPRGGGRYGVLVDPPADPAAYQVEYYLEARDGAGRLLARAGSSDAPLRLAVRGAPPDRARGWWRRPWVWGAVGAALLAGTALTLAASADRAPEGSLPPGRVDLQ